MSDDVFWAKQQQRICQALEQSIPSGAPVVFLDYPVYLNPGDLLIFLGTRSWLDRQDLEVLGQWNIHDFPFPSLPSNAVVLFQGGGNFGDLYPFQAFRESVIRAYPRNRIVFLPQTIHYESQAAKKRSEEILNGHNDLHLLLRDHRSLHLAESFFPSCRSALAPDMSAFLHPIGTRLRLDPSATAKQGVLYLLREDRELNSEEPVPRLGDGWEGDWRELLGHRLWWLRILKVEARVLGRRLPSQTFLESWTTAAERVAHYCALRFLAADRVVTSRLHGHLLASLVGVPNVLLDNSYGKNSSYFETWNQDLSGSQLSGPNSK